jgi:hypothetical protein
MWKITKLKKCDTIIISLANKGGTVVEHSPHEPKVEGSRPVTAADAGREKMTKRVLAKWVIMDNGTARFKSVNKCLNASIDSYLETSRGQSVNLYLNAVIFSTSVLIRRLWQLETVVFLHWCLASSN